jgi:hypothetical protein
MSIFRPSLPPRPSCESDTQHQARRKGREGLGKSRCLADPPLSAEGREQQQQREERGGLLATTPGMPPIPPKKLVQSCPKLPSSGYYRRDPPSSSGQGHRARICLHLRPGLLQVIWPLKLPLPLSSPRPISLLSLCVSCVPPASSPGPTVAGRTRPPAWTIIDLRRPARNLLTPPRSEQGGAFSLCQVLVCCGGGG